MATPTLADSLTAATAAVVANGEELLDLAAEVALREASAVKATGLVPNPADPTELAQACSLGPRFVALAGGSVNALAVQLAGGVPWPALLKGMEFTLPTLGPNTGPVAVSVSGFTAVPAAVANSGQPAGTLQLLGKNGGQLAAGDVTGQDVRVRFDGAGGLRLTGLSASELAAIGVGSAGALAGKLPIHAEFLQNGGVPQFTASQGQVILNPGQTWVWRQAALLSTDGLTLAQRTAALQPSKTYHYVIDAPGTGLAVPAANYPAGLSYVIDRSAVTETDAAYDGTFDRVLLARIVTDASGSPTVTALKNKAQLRATFRLTGTASQTEPVGNAYLANFLFTYNYPRAPDVPHRGTVEAVLVNNGGYIERGANCEQGDPVTSRYTTAIQVYTDWNYSGQPGNLQARCELTAIA